jgi:hypothetical protein
MGRAGGLAGRGAPFGNGIGPGNGLGVFFKRGPPGGQKFVVFIGNFNGADFGAFPAGRAFGGIDITGFLADAGRKPAGLAVK